MKPIGLPILAGLLLAALPALPLHAQLAPPPNPINELPTANLAATKSQYKRIAQLQYDEWYQRMADLNMRIVQNKVAMSRAAKRELDGAWDNVKRHWVELQTADARSWDNARASWTRAAQDMQRTWQEVAPQQG